MTGPSWLSPLTAADTIRLDGAFRMGLLERFRGHPPDPIGKSGEIVEVADRDPHQVPGSSAITPVALAYPICRLDRIGLRNTRLPFNLRRKVESGVDPIGPDWTRLAAAKGCVSCT